MDYYDILQEELKKGNEKSRELQRQLNERCHKEYLATAYKREPSYDMNRYMYNL